MTTVTLEMAQAEALVATGELVEVRDQTGAVIGFFAPVKIEYADQYAEMAARAHSVWGSVGPPPGSLTTAEVVARMEKLGAER